MSEEIKYLRMTIDVAVFDGAQKVARYLVKEGGSLGVGERAARIFMEAIKDGDIEIDEVRDVEDHT